MTTLILDGKYQVQEVLTAGDGFRACLCIDVETDSGYRPVIVNTYEREEDIRRLLPAFFRMREEGFPSLVRIVTGRGSLSVVFESRRGVRLGQHFGRGCRSDFEERCIYAHALLETALLLDTVPDFMAHACLSPENVMVLPSTRQMALQWVLPPEEIREAGFRTRNMAVLLSGMFVRDRFLPESVTAFIDDLLKGRCPSLATALSRWRELQKTLPGEHRKLLAETWFRSIVRRLRGKVRAEWEKRQVHRS